MSDLERMAQNAAEQRLAHAQSQVFGDDDEPVIDGGPTVGPFCGCDTCIVREVLDAAWPYLLELAREEVRAETRDEVPG